MSGGAKRSVYLEPCQRPVRRDVCAELRQACLYKNELGEQGAGNCRRYRETFTNDLYKSRDTYGNFLRLVRPTRSCRGRLVSIRRTHPSELVFGRSHGTAAISFAPLPQHVL